MFESHLIDFRKGFRSTDVSIDQYTYNYINTSYHSKLRIPTPTRIIHPIDHIIKSLLDDVMEFWRVNMKELHNSIKESSNLITQIGEISSHGFGYDNACTRLGVYFDAICVLDPLYIAAKKQHMHKQSYSIVDLSFSLNQLLESVLIIDRISPLMKSETDIPIAIIVPPSDELKESTQNFFELTPDEYYSNALISEATGYEYSNIDDWFNLIDEKSEEFVLSALEQHSVYGKLIKTYEANSIIEIAQTYRNGYPDFNKYYNLNKLPEKFRNFCTIFLIISNTFKNLEWVECSASQLGIDHCIPKHHWELYKTKAAKAEQFIRNYGIREELPIQAALMSKKMDWLTAVCIEDLLKIRESGLMENYREIFRVNRRKLRKSTIENYIDLSQEIIDEINAKLDHAHKELQIVINEQNRRWFSRIPRIVMGVICQFFPVLNILGLLIEGASIESIIKDYKKDKGERNELENRPIIHMFEIMGRSKD